VNEIYGLAGTLAGAAALVLAGLFAARATRHAAVATAEAQRAAAQVAAEPDQRQADLQAFNAIKDDLKAEVADLRTRTISLTSLVRSFALYVSDLTGQMRLHGIEPPAPPSRVDEYNRTGV